MQTTTSPHAEAKSVVKLAFLLRDTIRELKSIPSGHLYANIMQSVSLENYQWAIGILEEANLIRISNHLITWIKETK